MSNDDLIEKYKAYKEKISNLNQSKKLVSYELHMSRKKFAENAKIRNVTQSKDPIWLEKTRTANLKSKQNPIWQENVAKSNKKKWKDPEWAKWMNERWHAKDNDPKRTAKISKAKTQWWKQSDRLEKMSTKSKEQWKDPEYVEKVMASQRIAVTTPLGEFKSQGAFKEKTGMQFRDKNIELPHLYYVTSKGPGEPIYQDVCVTCLGEFRTRLDAFNAHIKANDLRVGPLTAKGAEWRYTQWWNNVCKKYPDDFYIKNMVKRDWNC